MPFQSNFVKFSLNIDKNKMFTIVEFFNLFNFENVQNFLRFDILTLGNIWPVDLLVHGCYNTGIFWPHGYFSTT